MIIKTLIVTVILVAIVMLTLGIKMLFDKNAKFEVYSCSFDSDDAKGTSHKCQIIDSEECPDNKK